jgi:tetratricopeptide (TPR) repeat protein
MENTELKHLLQQGIAAARAGEKGRARELLLQVIDQDEGVEAAWLWLSGVMGDPAERQICLENVLALNPNNQAAQAGLRWLAEQSSTRGPAPPTPEAPRPVLTPVPDEPPAEPPRPPRPAPVAVEIDPFGCPYCAGSILEEAPRCAHCGRTVALRYRKRAAGAWLSWLVLALILLGLASWGETLLVSQLVEVGRLPEWLNQTVVRFLVGAALFRPDGVPGELAAFADTFILVNQLLAGLCLIAALGVALRLRVAYLSSFLLAGFVVAGTGVGLLTQLVGWLPALFRLGLVALVIRWLVDSAPGFEWETRSYNADLDHDLKNDLDYYNRGVRYRDMGMWAKAAAHWKVAGQLNPAHVEYRTALANAYVRMGYPQAALAEAETALRRFSEDDELRAFRDSLAALVEEEAP